MNWMPSPSVSVSLIRSVPRFGIPTTSLANASLDEKSPAGGDGGGCAGGGAGA
jgi:hypothetical protein